MASRRAESEVSGERASPPRPGVYRVAARNRAEQADLVASVANDTAHAANALQEHMSAGALHETRLHLATSIPGRPLLKLENQQVTGSFKARGALYAVSKAANDGARGVVTASTGNHARAIAHAATVHELRCVVYVGNGCITRAKRDMLTPDVRVREASACADGVVGAEMQARAYARARAADGWWFVSPYNDRAVVAGQGTVGEEIARQMRVRDGSDLGTRGRGTPSVYVTVGGGGLVSGIGCVLHSRGWRVVGCLPQQSAAMLGCVQAGRAVQGYIGKTVADGSAGGVEEGSMTIGLCGAVVDCWVVVSEEEIMQAMGRLYEDEGEVRVEGAGGVALAGFLRDDGRDLDGEAVVVICGGNVEDEVLNEARQCWRDRRQSCATNGCCK